MEFFSHEIREPDQDLLALFDTIGSQIGQFIERLKAEAGLQAAIQKTKQVEEQKNRLKEQKLYLEDEIRNEYFGDIVGESEPLKQVLEQIQTVAATDATVLILGETGTGKELIARALHNQSNRKTKTFVKLNCSAIPTGLLESELFGHERGAFTGAIAQKMGRLELADRGTLFLDEIGDIPTELQPKLLRALQEQEFERLGSNRTIKADVRLIAATNRDLPQMVASKYAYRLNKQIQSIPAETMQALVRWHWPGNIRELENIIERAVILSPSTVLNVPIFEFQSKAPEAPRVAAAAAAAAAVSGPSKSAVTLEDKEREHILKVLRETKGVLSGPSGAAALLGLKRTTLQGKMKKLGIDRDDI
jgi:formate hydrogenlyase transcriptional activator